MMKSGIFPVGKLPMSVLAGLLARHGSHDERVVVGAGVGRDATVIDMGDRYLVAKSDPITFATDQIGWYAVNVCANDLACSGAQPRWFLAAVLLPEASTDQALIETIFEQISTACRTLGASLTGGHTEITRGLKRPIVVGQMLGEVAKDKLVVSSGAQPGDIILMTKAAAIEGTALIAYEKEKELRSHGYDQAFLDQAKNLLFRPGISVTSEALLAVQAAPIHAMHDPTEGGVFTGLREIAQASNLGLMIDAEAIPVLPACERLCRQYNLHPMGLIASGALLITVAPQHAQRVCDALTAAQIPCTAIGHMLPAQEGCKMRVGGMPRELPAYERDEITRIL
jgi:hydrogenase expression/formation protein HypE